MSLETLLVQLWNLIELLWRVVLALAGVASLVFLFQAWKSRVEERKRVLSVKTGNSHAVWCMNAPRNGARISESAARKLGYREGRCCSRKRDSDLDSRD